MSIFHVERNPTSRQLRQFGAIGAALLILVAWWQRQSPAVALAAGLVGATLLVCTAWCPRVLKRPFVWLSAALYPIGLVVGEVVLAATYFLVITPIAMAFRLLRRDALKRTLDRQGTTYWEEADRQQTARSYFRQY